VPLRGFLRDERGRFTPIQIPGARQVQALGINARGQIVGDYLAADGTTHGYLRDHGRIITVDGPAGAAGATVFDINDHGQMVGLYYGSAGEFHAFSLRGGRYTSIDAPGVTYTLPFGVNNRGQIVGLTAAALPLTAASDAHGFVLRDGAGGPLTPVDVPGAVFGTAVSTSTTPAPSSASTATPTPRRVRRPPARRRTCPRTCHRDRQGRPHHADPQRVRDHGRPRRRPTGRHVGLEQSLGVATMAAFGPTGTALRI
jgi:hypothetical protein